MNPDLIDALMRHRRRHAGTGYSPTETFTAIRTAPAVTQRRAPRRDWLGILVVLPVAALGLALVVAAGAWGDAQGRVRTVHLVRVVREVRTVTASPAPAPPPLVRLEAARPQFRTVTAPPRPAPVVTVTVTATPQPVPAVTVTVTAAAPPPPVATP